MKTIREILGLCTNYLHERGISNARREAEDMLSDALGLKRIALYMDFDRPLTTDELTRCRERLARRAKGEPLAYIHGEVTFADCTLTVTPAVLIPRQETEILVEKIAENLKERDLQGKILWDVCCGSGCIGIALKKRFPDLTVELSDISKEALAIAKANAIKNEVEVVIHEGDLLAPFTGRQCHFFTCNPPYIAGEEYATLSREVREHEPRLALVAEDAGYVHYRRLAQELPQVLHRGGQVWFEIGYQMGPQLSQMFADTFWKKCFVEKDWAGHDRFFFLENE